MNRRNALTSIASVALAGLPREMPAGESIRTTLAWRGDKWQAVRMRGLRQGDVFVMRNPDGLYVEDSYWKAVSHPSPKPPPVHCMVETESMGAINWDNEGNDGRGD